MKFEGNRAWQQAVASVAANRDVLIALGGVFFLLPGVIATIFLSDVQAALMANMGNPAAAEAALAGNEVPVFAGMTMLFLIQLVGYMAMLALLTDRERPTVGQAIMIALRTLPSLIAATLLIAIAYVLIALIVSMVAAGAAMVSQALMAPFILLLVVFVTYAAVKLSLTLPVMVIDKVLNPVAALSRSWQLTRGNSLRLFGFYLLLALAYLVIAIVFGMIFGVVVALLASQGTMAVLLSGIVSGIAGAIAGIYFTGVLAAIHRQLAGPSIDAHRATFE